MQILEPVGTGPTWQIKLMADCMVVVFHLMLLCTACTGSYLVALVTGMILGITVGFGHNFHHQNDNFRRHVTILTVVYTGILTVIYRYSTYRLAEKDGSSC